MDKKPYVTYGDGGCCSSCPCGKGDITGCRFSLYPMTDSFISAILGAISKVRTDKVWKETDALSTVCQGEQRRLAVVTALVGGGKSYCSLTSRHMAKTEPQAKGYSHA